MARRWQVGLLAPEREFLGSAGSVCGFPQVWPLSFRQTQEFWVDLTLQVPGPAVVTCKVNPENFLLGKTCSDVLERLQGLWYLTSLVWGSKAQERSLGSFGVWRLPPPGGHGRLS